MEKCLKQTFCFSLISMGTVVFAQQKISGRITDEGALNISSVLVVNISNNTSVQTDDTGRFAIDAKENDEVRFVKEGYYRVSKKITREDMNAPFRISLKKMEIEIAEVKIKYNPTGNLAKDNQYLNESMKLRNLKSELGEYMLGPLNEPLPDNTVSKTFTGHDFKAGQVDLLGVFRAFSGLVRKATKANYFETQDFLARVKREINLDFLKKYGMDEEQIDKFLLYANRNRLLAKKNRKDFQIDVIEYELRVAFAEYKKVNNLEGINNKD